MRQEALNLIDQLIQQKMTETGKSHIEVSREMFHKLRDENEPEITAMKYQSKAHQEATEQKMKSVAQYQKSPKNWDKIDKQIQEMFEDHGQINPNKKVNHEITTMDEAQIQKMQEYNQREKLAVSEMMKSPMSSEEMDRVIQEHYEVHNQVNPNKKNC